MNNQKTYKVSPSGIGMLLECPRCLWLFANEDITRPRGIFPSLPNGMDDVFKNYFDTYRANGTLPPEIDGKVKGKLYNNMENLNVWRNIDFGRGGLKAEFPELSILLQGAVDEVLITDSGQYIPLDFKTRGYPTKHDTHEHYQQQLDLYALLFEQNNLPSSSVGYLLFFWPKSYKGDTAEFKSELIKMKISPQNGRKILQEVHDVVTGPQPSKHATCEYCHYREPEI